jgi:hypothetical protein
MSNVEFYEALKRSNPEEAARLIAGVVAPTHELATKLDIAGVNEKIAELRVEIQKVSASTMGWMLAFFIPVWAGTWATVIAVVLKG